MPRERRNIEPGFPHHITQRSNNGIKVFLDKEDHLRFLEIFMKNVEKWNIQVLAYCLMPNHFHFLLIPQDQESLSMAIGRSSRAYAIYFNKKYNRKNHLWGTRFFSSIIADDLYLIACAAYIDSNPVRACMVNDADQYFWSSATNNINGDTDKLMPVKSWLPPSQRNDYKAIIVEYSNRYKKRKKEKALDDNEKLKNLTVFIKDDFSDFSLASDKLSPEDGNIIQTYLDTMQDSEHLDNEESNIGSCLPSDRAPPIIER